MSCPFAGTYIMYSHAPQTDDLVNDGTAYTKVVP